MDWGILSIEKIIINIGDYPLSYIEFIGTLLYFGSVWLISVKNRLTWPVGIVSVVLYGILFYQIQLYSDMIEQFYYLGISFMGWISWNKIEKNEEKIPTKWSSKNELFLWIVFVAIASFLLAQFSSNLNLLLPEIFPDPASYAGLDAVTTVMSFVAMYLITIRRNESWVYWIVVDVLGIYLYWIKDVRFIAIQYIFLLFIAVWGLITWSRLGKERTDRSNI